MGIDDVLTGARADAELAQALFDGSPVGIAFVEPDDAGVLRITDANQALGAILGRTPDELRGAPIAGVLDAEDRHFEGLRRACDIPVRCRRAAGGVVHAQVRIRPHPASPHRRAFIAHVVDVGAEPDVAAHLEHVRAHDGLTGLLNRRAFELELALADGANAVAVFGVDGLGQINSRRGAAAGDRALRAVADVLRAVFRPPDVVARLGGDEFAVLLRRPGNPVDAVDGALASLRAMAPEVDGAALSITASAGVAAGMDPAAAAREAALALLSAKEAGRDRCHPADRSASTMEVIRERLLWGERLRDALASDRFRLFEQPILQIADGRLSRSELLLRLDDGTGRLASPGQFMAAAERSGLIRAIDLWVVRRAMLLLAARQAGRRDACPVQVNLSASSLSDADTVAALTTLVGEAPIDTSALTFEVTETTAIDDVDVARGVIERLTGLGCSFAIDDFGAGYGSFAYLRRLPVTQLKIDGEFIRGLTSSRTDRATVRAMVDVAREYGLKTVAEFVEDEPTLQAVAELGIDYAQGYHIGRPRPALIRPDF